MPTEEEIVEELCLVKDNLWIGDIDEVKKVTSELSTKEFKEEEKSKIKKKLVIPQASTGRYVDFLHGLIP
jgi:hypothetical protein